jgi:hypothetical protein
MQGSTILKVLGGAAVVTTLFAFKKKGDFSKVIEQMTMDIRNIRNLKPKNLFSPNAGVSVDIDIAFHNPTQYDMTAYTAGTIDIQKIQVFYKGTLLGNAVSKAGENKFELPAYGNYLIPNITVDLLLLNIVNQFMNGGLDTNVDNYKVVITVQALGKTWIVEQ